MDLAIIYNVLSPIIASAITWKLARPKNKADTRKTHAEAKDIEIGNMDGVLKLWQELVSDLTYQIDDMRKEVLVFRHENRQLKDEILILQKQNSELKADLIKLKDMLKKTSL